MSTDLAVIRQTRPALTRRPDFFDLWSDTLASLGRVPAEPRLGTVVRAPDGVRIAPVRFRSLGEVGIQGFLVTRDEPASSANRPRPLVVTTHGYNSRCEPVVESRHVLRGVDVFCFDVRGFGLSRPDCVVDRDGYVLTGLTDSRTSILRGAVCDYIRAVEVARVVHGGTTGTLAFHGRSFGGGLALMAQALAPRADYVAVSVPTFGWMAGRRALVRAGSGKEINDYLATHPAHEATVMRTLTYFDTVNFADRVRCPALLGVGLRDEVVPPAAVYAIANHMVPPPEVMELPVSHSDDLAEARWTEFDDRWVATVLGLS